MRVVPFDRLLIQPAVHRDWFQRAGGLTFELDAATAARFATYWRAYERAGHPAPAHFLQDHPLTEDDHVFALFCAAATLHAEVADLVVTTTDTSVRLARAGD